jgi:hypothetical protein
VRETLSLASRELWNKHAEGCRFLTSLASVNKVPCDITVVTNGGYPLDQNITKRCLQEYPVGGIDELGAMVGQNCVVRRDSREHGFSPTGETGKQVWLNETLRKQQVRFGCNRLTMHSPPMEACRF